MGSCRGLLTVSRNGVAFAPDQSGEAKDAFRFRYGQSVQDLSSEGLTIKSSARTYRFKSAVVGAEDNGADLPAIVLERPTAHAATVAVRPRRGYPVKELSGFQFAGDAAGHTVPNVR